MLGFEEMRFNPLSNNLLDEHPELLSMKSWAELRKGNPYDKILAYIIAMYSKDSPLLRIPDYKDRAITALKEVGITRSFSAHDNLIELSGEEGKYDTLLLVHDYLAFQQNKLFSLITVNERNFYLLQKEMLEESSGKDDNQLMIILQKKSQIMEEMDKISKRLDSYYSEFFMENNEVKEKIERLDFCSPESVAAYLSRLTNG